MKRRITTALFLLAQIAAQPQAASAQEVIGVNCTPRHASPYVSDAYPSGCNNITPLPFHLQLTLNRWDPPSTDPMPVTAIVCDWPAPLPYDGFFLTFFISDRVGFPLGSLGGCSINVAPDFVAAYVLEVDYPRGVIVTLFDVPPLPFPLTFYLQAVATDVWAGRTATSQPIAVYYPPLS